MFDLIVAFGWSVRIAAFEVIPARLVPLAFRDTADLCPHSREPFLNSLVPAIDMIDTVNQGLALRRQAREHERSAGTQARSLHLGTAQAALAAHYGAPPTHGDVRSHAPPFR